MRWEVLLSSATVYKISIQKTKRYTHRRTGRHFTGGAEKICPENNNLPKK